MLCLKVDIISTNLVLLQETVHRLGYVSGMNGVMVWICAVVPFLYETCEHFYY